MKKSSLPTIDVKKYGGKQVAIVDGRIVASGLTLSEVIKKARRTFPSKPLNEVTVFSVPESLSVLYYTWNYGLRCPQT